MISYLEETVLRVEAHDGVVVEVLGQRQLVDLERALEGRVILSYIILRFYYSSLI